MLSRNPGYDVRQLLQGSGPGLRQLMSRCSRSLGWLLEAVEPLGGIAPADRDVAVQGLKTAVTVRKRGGAFRAGYGTLAVCARVCGWGGIACRSHWEELQLLIGTWPCKALRQPSR